MSRSADVVVSASRGVAFTLGVGPVGIGVPLDMSDTGWQEKQGLSRGRAVANAAQPQRPYGQS